MNGLSKTQLLKRKSAVLTKGIKTAMGGAPIYDHGYNHCDVTLVSVLKELNKLIDRL